MGIVDRIMNAFVGPVASPTRASERVESAHVEVVQDAVPTQVNDPRNMDVSPERGLGGANTLLNMMSGAGTSRDAGVFARWVAQRRLGRGELFALGRNALTARGLGLVGNTATREWLRVITDDKRVTDPQDVTIRIAQYEQRLGIPGKAARASFRARQYSHAIILLNIIDGRKWDEPVDVNNIVSIRWAVVIDRRDFYINRLADADSVNFGQPAMYRITDINGVLEDGLRYGDDLATMYSMYDTLSTEGKLSAGVMDVHADRVLSFHTTDYYPLLEGMQDSLSAYFETARGIQQWAREASMKIYTVSNLLKKVFGLDASIVHQRLSLIERMKSSLNAWVIDDTEKVENVSSGGGGIDKANDPNMVWVSTSFGIPITQYWGVSPGGFGTGDSERLTWHEEVRAYQDQVLAANACLPKLHGYILAADDGCNLFTDIRRVIEFNDLSPPDEETRSKLRTEAIADISKAYDAGVITREEARASLAELSDDLLPFARTPEGELVSRDAPVGVFTGSLEILRAAALGEIPPDSGRLLLEYLAPSSFTSERATSIFSPIVAKLATATVTEPPIPGAPPSTSTPGSATQEDTPESPAEGPTPEEIEEDAELVKLLSTLEVPADALTADLVAAQIPGVSADQVKRRAKQGDFTVYPPEGFGTRPRFSVAEVKRALLRRHGVLPTETETSTASGVVSPVEPVADFAEQSVCVVIELPTVLARWVPYKSNDPSPPHVTVIYFSNTDGCTESILACVRGVCESFAPPVVRLTGEVAYFNRPETSVAYSVVDSPDVVGLNDALVDALLSAGLSPSEFSVDYTPHTTLAYTGPGEKYEGPIPKGEFVATTLAVYVGNEHSLDIEFNSTKTDAPAIARDIAEPTIEVIHQWLREHYCMAPKLTRPRIEALIALRSKYSFLRPPRVDLVYRGLTNVKPSSVGKLLADTDPVRDKCWTTDLDQAIAFATGEYIDPADVDPLAIGVVLFAEADPEILLLNAAEIANIPEIGEYFNPIWQMTIAQSIRDEAEVLAHGSLRVVEVRAVPTIPTIQLDAADPEERIAEAFKRYHESVNMGEAELSEWSKSPWSKKASLSNGPIDRNLTLLSTPRNGWTLRHAESAMRTVSFVSRMKGAEQGQPVKIDGREGPSKRDISLKNWAFDPKK